MVFSISTSQWSFCHDIIVIHRHKSCNPSASPPCLVVQYPYTPSFYRGDDRMDNHRIRRIVQRMILVILVIFVASVLLTRVFFEIFEGRSITLLQSIMFVMQTYTTTGYGELLPFTSDIMNLYASVQMVLGTGLILFGLATAGGAWMQTHFQEIPPKKVP